jgi:hypothetical protein
MTEATEKLKLPSKAILLERLRARFSRPHPAPLILFGNQKAGGTAIAGLLAAATGLRATLDLSGTKAPYFAQLMQGKVSLKTFVHHNAFSFSAPIIKDGSLTFVGAPLMEHFGLTRAGFIIRDPFDNIRSILDRLKLPGHLQNLDISTLKINRTWKSILAGEDIGLPKGHYIETLARRWLAATEFYERERQRLTLVRYDRFCADKAGTIQWLARTFNLSAHHDVTALLDHPFQRRGTPTCDWEGFFGHDNLERITQICGSTAMRLGYYPPVLPQPLPAVTPLRQFRAKQSATSRS